MVITGKNMKDIVIIHEKRVGFVPALFSEREKK